MTVVFTEGPIFTGDGQVIDSATVVVEGETIQRVASGNTDIPKTAQVIDLNGCMLLPGFIDCHLHLLIDGSPNPLAILEHNSVEMITLLATVNARNTLMAGVTTVRDMGGNGSAEMAIRDAVEEGIVFGPRMLVSGKQICMTGGHGWEFGREADGPDEVRKAAREQIKAGCDVVKLMATGGIMTKGVDPGAAQLTEAELRAGVQEAHRANKKCAAHAQGTEGILNSLRAGIDTIEHGYYLNEECVSLMQQKRIPYIPTLAATVLMENAAEFGVPEFIVEKSKRVVSAHIQSVQMAKEANLLFGMGADCGTPLLPHGSNLLELVSLVKQGFRPEEALKIGTLNGAVILGLDHLTGSIEEGKRADLVVVEGNPINDINTLADPENIRLVMKDGKIIPAPL